jgi:hypothetical protein
MAKVVVHWIRKQPGGPIRSPGLILSKGPPLRRMGGGRFVIPCLPKRRNTHGLVCSSSPLAVTCPACRQAEGFPAQVEPLLIRGDQLPATLKQQLEGKGKS